MRARRRALVAVLSAGLVAGCLAGPAPVDHFYRLDASAPTAQGPQRLAGVLEVERLRADALSGERALVYRKSDQPSQLHRHAYHHWVDPPTVMLQLEIARFLREAGFAERVVMPEQRVESDVVLSGRIARMERVVGSTPRVLLELEFTATRGSEILLLETYREDREAAGAAMNASVAAWQEALDAILGRLLADLAAAGGG